MNMRRNADNPPYATKADVREIVTEAFDSFALIMKRSFDDVYGRLDTMDNRMDGLVTKDEFQPFKKETEQSLYELKTDVGHIKNRLGKVGTRLDGMENRLDVMDVKIDTLIETHVEHEGRIIRLEQKTA